MKRGVGTQLDGAKLECAGRIENPMQMQMQWKLRCNKYAKLKWREQCLQRNRLEE